MIFTLCKHCFKNEWILVIIIFNTSGPSMLYLVKNPTFIRDIACGNFSGQQPNSFTDSVDKTLTRGCGVLNKYSIDGPDCNIVNCQTIVYNEKNDKPGLQSVRREQTESRTFETVNAGLQLSLRMSKQMIPWLLMLQ